MRITNPLFLAILKKTRNAPAKIDELAEESGTPIEDLQRIIEDMVELGTVTLEENGSISANSHQRLRLAFDMANSGGDIGRICKYLSWQEFEEASANILEEFGYRVLHRFRFKADVRRWEIDLLGIRKPFILCLDCKHWKGGWQRSALARAIEAQIKRVKELANFMKVNREKLSLQGWGRSTLLPVMIVLLDVPLRIYEGVPAVPVFRLSNFLYELPAAIDTLNSFRVSVD